MLVVCNELNKALKYLKTCCYKQNYFNFEAENHAMLSFTYLTKCSLCQDSTPNVLNGLYTSHWMLSPRKLIVFTKFRIYKIFFDFKNKLIVMAGEVRLCLYV